MYQPFQTLSPQAFLWIYQAQRKLSNSEQTDILEKVRYFATEWISHGRPLTAGAELRYDYLLLIGIEKPEFELSCCTTDRLMQLLNTIQINQGINFLDRRQLLVETAGQRILMTIQEAKEQWQQKIIGDDSYIFDNTISKKNELETCWRIPIAQFFT